jgi:hypothetical protein
MDSPSLGQDVDLHISTRFVHIVEAIIERSSTYKKNSSITTSLIISHKSKKIEVICLRRAVGALHKPKGILLLPKVPKGQMNVVFPNHPYGPRFEINLKNNLDIKKCECVN